MSPMTRRSITRFGFAVALALTVSSGRAENAAPTAALEAVDRALTRFEAMLARDDHAAHRAATQAVCEDLKKRRDALRAAFDAGKCEELRVDLNLEYQRLAAWMAPPRLPAGAKEAPRPEVGYYELDPTPTDAAEVKAALDALDREIQRRDLRAQEMPEGAARTAARARLDALRRARGELGGEFTRERWRAVVREFRQP